MLSKQGNKSNVIKEVPSGKIIESLEINAMLIHYDLERCLLVI